MLADAVVDSLVVSAEDDDVFERRESVCLVLVVAHAVGRGVDDLVVGAFVLELLDEFEDRLALHDHSGLAAERIVVGGLAAVVRIVVEIMDDNFYKTLLLGAAEDRLVQG